ncbi:hypothetical protein DVH24_039393 [Malus domestica]|uniref:Pentatricopeptide repeat-containing protein n=1 Tax=Malus domestica TaxID=3750 RepID=A0A498I011_MALDO|nr:hypothetical protein DVH24_039393 [Malus domestica]
MYAMCGSPLDSRSVFDGLKRKNLFQWNALVSGSVEDAAKVFEIMPDKNCNLFELFSRRTALFLFWFIIVSLQIPKTIGEAQPEVEKNEEADQQTAFGRTMQDTMSMLYDTISVLQKSHQNAWDKVKTIINDMQLQFSPPNLEGSKSCFDPNKRKKRKKGVCEGVFISFRGGDEANAKGSEGDDQGMGGKVKEAAQKSFETSKHTVEESAKSAGEAVGGTVHKTAEKVKETVASPHEETPAAHAEL